MNRSVISVPNVRPPMMEAASEPNIASGSSGIIPRMVVSAAMVTGRRRLWALSTSAVIGSTPWLSYKGNFFPNFSLSGTGIYSTSDGSLGIAGGNLPTFQPDATGQFLPNKGFAYFPGIALNYKIGMVYMGGIQVEQPLYMGGKIRAAYKRSHKQRDRKRK